MSSLFVTPSDLCIAVPFLHLKNSFAGKNGQKTESHPFIFISQNEIKTKNSNTIVLLDMTFNFLLVGLTPISAASNLPLVYHLYATIHFTLLIRSWVARANRLSRDIQTLLGTADPVGL